MKFKTAAVGLLAAVLLAANPVPAQAIGRAPCNDKNVTIYSPNPTCWAWKGTVHVKLYATTGATGGINTGYVIIAGKQARFYPDVLTSWWPAQTVTQVTIY